jgi:hypothetical protein
MTKWILVTVGSIVVTVSAAWPALAGNFGGHGSHGGGAVGVPELSATAAGGAIALLAGGFMLLAERRRKSS